MATIDVEASIDLDSPTLVEGLPGVGLVGKIATDHLVNEFDMTYYAGVHCEGLPKVTVYEQGERALKPPVRLYADAERNLLALQSDIPVSPESAPDFSDCLVEFLASEGVLPLCLSGLPQQREGEPALYGVGVGEATSRLDDLSIEAPAESGLVSGPTGAILADCADRELAAIGLIVQANPQFPDPEAARTLLESAIKPLADIEVDTTVLIEHAEEIAAARENLAKRMRQADDESSQAQPLGMYQ